METNFSACLSVSNGFSSLTAHRIIRTSQSCPLGTRDYLTLLLLQSPHPTISACSLCSWVQPLCDPTSCVVLSCPGLWIYVIMWLIYDHQAHLSRVMDTCLAIPIALGQESLLPQQGEKEAIKTHASPNTFVNFTFTDCSYIHIFIFELKIKM